MGADGAGSGVLGEAIGHHHVEGKHDLVPVLGEELTHLADVIGVDQRRPDLQTSGGKQREAHAPADQHPVDPGQEVAHHPQLVGDLGATEHHHVGTGRVAEQQGERLDLGGEQRPGRRGQQFGDAHGRGVGSVRRAEGVEHEPVGELGQGGGESRVVAGLPRLEAACSPARRRCPRGRRRRRR